MTAAILIPARMDSTRFPGKPLAMLDGKPLIRHCYDNARASWRANFVLVVTNSREIEEYCVAHSMYCRLDEQPYPTGSDRIAATLPLTAGDGSEVDIVVNLQCDEPDVTGDVLDRLIGACELIGEAVTVRCPITNERDRNHPNIVKVVVNHIGKALYFTRKPLPCADAHIGVYAYPIDVLRRFASWPQAGIERGESLEQLRLLLNGETLHTVCCSGGFHAINVPEDIK